MDTKTVTLAEFLLERIAEDEGEANYLRNVGVRGAQYGSINGALRYVIDRVLTDAEAKRRIVELHETGVDSWCVSECYDGNRDGCATLKTLAAVYSDHTDYRQEWRP